MKFAARTGLAVPCLALLAMLSALAFGWGFTVDDALISTRVAHHLQIGVGYRMNADGDPVDCVTPFGWAYLLAPFAETPYTGLAVARLLGVASALAVALLVGHQSRDVPWARFLLVLLPMALCLPLGAWSSSGMETPLVMLLLAGALFPKRAALAAVTAAAALRPELVPFAFVHALLRPAPTRGVRVVNLLLGLSGPLLVGLLRVAWFGHPAPLAVLAKPSDLGSGVWYVAAGCLWLGLPVLLMTYRPWFTLSAHARNVALSCAVHVGAIAVAGGDWMALFRLFVPILPLLLFVAAQLARTSSPWAVGARSLVASLVCATLLVNQGPATRGVWQSRANLSRAAAPLLAEARRVATLDVGWVGASTGASLVDLAGVTELEVALLPGGHTSKRLPPDFLLRREPDTLVLLLAKGVSEAEIAARPWTELVFARVVEQRLTRLEGASEYVTVGSLPLPGTTQRYLIAKRLQERFARSD